MIFALTLAEVFLVLGAYAANSPYSHIGAERELLQIMAYEPMFLLAAVGMYVVTKSFNVSDIAGSSALVSVLLPGVFLGFVYILTIKLRKSPFDLSTSHHAHQEIVKGVTTEFRARRLALSRSPTGTKWSSCWASSTCSLREALSLVSSQSSSSICLN